jgi:hypothetical protein
MNKLTSQAIRILVILALVILVVSLATDFWSSHK